MTKQARLRLRTFSGGLLVSLGTAMFAGAVSLLLDALVKGTDLHGRFLAASTILGLALSGSGTWLLSSARVGVGLSIAAIDQEGDPGRYQADADSFTAYAARCFVFHTAVNAPVDAPADLSVLRGRLDTALQTLTRAEPRSATIGLYFTGRHEVGFYLGSGLNRGGRRVDLYSPAEGDNVAFFPAIRLTASPSHPACELKLQLSTGGNFGPVTVRDLTDRLSGGTCQALAVNLHGSASDAAFAQQVHASARDQGAAALVIAERPVGAVHPIPATTREFESTVAAIVAVAKAMPAAPGLLYLRTPAVIAVALGRYLHGAGWIAMRHDRSASTYVRFRPDEIPGAN